MHTFGITACVSDRHSKVHVLLGSTVLVDKPPAADPEVEAQEDAGT